jgi:hypothetical protein
VGQVGAWPENSAADGGLVEHRQPRGHKKAPTTDVEAKLEIRLVLTLQSSFAKS